MKIKPCKRPEICLKTQNTLPPPIEIRIVVVSASISNVTHSSPPDYHCHHRENLSAFAPVECAFEVLRTATLLFHDPLPITCGNDCPRALIPQLPLSILSRPYTLMMTPNTQISANRTRHCQLSQSSFSFRFRRYYHLHRVNRMREPAFPPPIPTDVFSVFPLLA